MSNPKCSEAYRGTAVWRHASLSLRHPWPLLVSPFLLAAVLLGCSSSGGSSGTGGVPGTGGTPSTTGGTANSGGTVTSGTGGASGGTFAATGGGSATGGVVSSGGTSVVVSTGGVSSGGSSSAMGGASATGGVIVSGGGGVVAASGGTASTGGANVTGGKTAAGGAAGSSATGGVLSGGAAATGGASAGGSLGGQGGTAVGGSTGATGGAGGGAMPILDSILVPGGGNSVSSTIKLDLGELYLLKATGTLDTGTDKLDAEYSGFGTGGAGQDLVAGVDVGVDTGFKVERGTNPGRKKWFGSYRTDHTYYLIVTGTGAAMPLKMVGSTGVGTGGVTVSVMRLSPYPPALPSALESLKASVTNLTVKSAMAPTLSTVYLLQVAGAGKCGGSNLGQGDADWMDWDVNGVGKEDIGDNNVDYGLGVDEANTAVTPRLRWWGPWRKDHTYYMLYAGTGNPISFYYYDSGYGDNSTTDKLTVQIFPAP